MVGRDYSLSHRDQGMPFASRGDLDAKGDKRDHFRSSACASKTGNAWIFTLARQDTRADVRSAYGLHRLRDRRRDHLPNSEDELLRVLEPGAILA